MTNDLGWAGTIAFVFAAVLGTLCLSDHLAGLPFYQWVLDLIEHSKGRFW